MNSNNYKAYIPIIIDILFQLKSANISERYSLHAIDVYCNLKLCRFSCNRVKLNLIRQNLPLFSIRFTGKLILKSPKRSYLVQKKD